MDTTYNDLLFIFDSPWTYIINPKVVIAFLYTEHITGANMTSDTQTALFVCGNAATISIGWSRLYHGLPHEELEAIEKILSS